MKTVKIHLNGREHTFDVARRDETFHVVLAGNERKAWIQHHDGRYLVLEIEQAAGSRQRLHIAGMANGEQRQVWVDGRMLNYERVRPQRQSTAAADGSLAASIPAIVSQILVSPGDIVSAGDKLILLESMKMVIPIQAPYDGRVTQINCTVGDSVPAGIQLLELEPLNS